MAGGNRKIGGITGLGDDPTPTSARGSWSREEQYYFKRRGKWPIFPSGPIALAPGDYFFAASSGVVMTSGVSFVPAQGTTVDRVEYSTLFDTIGTNFGNGDGVNTFTLPKVADQFGYLKADITKPSGIYSSGTLPAHQHDFYAFNGTGSLGQGVEQTTPVLVSGFSSYDGSYNNGRFKEAVCCIASADIDYPVGSVLSVMLPVDVETLASTIPSNLVIASGQALSRTAYPDLWSRFGTLYGNGDGSTTFNIPDYRGVFIRGLQGSNNGLRVQPSGAVTGSGYFESTVHRHRHQWGPKSAHPPNSQNPSGPDVGTIGGEAYAGDTSTSNIGSAEGHPRNITCVHLLVVENFVL